MFVGPLFVSARRQIKIDKDFSDSNIS